jgi:hypothetical protein
MLLYSVNFKEDIILKQLYLKSEQQWSGSDIEQWESEAQ